MSHAKASEAKIRSVVGDLVAERTGSAGHALTAGDLDRFVATVEGIPAGCQSVLDVGCGLGVMTDSLASLGFTAHGVDVDAQALVHVKSATTEASVAALPFEDGAFDCVVANEVLEHLPVPIFAGSLAEINRVAKRAIVVTVPNEESLESATTQCRRCACIYSVHGHVRRFSPAQVAGLFPGLTPTRMSTVGPWKLRHRSIEYVIRRRLLGLYPRAPGAVCPQCGEVQPGQRSIAARATPGRRAVEQIAGIPWHRWWIVAVYEREGLG